MEENKGEWPWARLSFYKQDTNEIKPWKLEYTNHGLLLIKRQHQNNEKANNRMRNGITRYIYLRNDLYPEYIF